MKRSALRLLLVGILIPAAFAKAPLHLDPSLASVVTAGRWESAGAHGAYRILLFHGGLEHTNSTVVAEWVADPTHDTDRRVVYSKLLVDTCLCSLKPPQVEPLPIGVRVTLTGEL